MTDENSKIEIIDLKKRNDIRFRTSIAATREDSIDHERMDRADFKAYSDGSGQEDGIGASAVLYKKSFVRPVKSLKAFLGSKSKRNTYEAETIGAILAIWLIRNTPEVIGKTVSLYIDNQAVIKAIPGVKPASGQHLTRALVTAANDLPCKLVVKWISSHSEVKGNEEADKLAKDAARGRSSRTIDLPHLLRTPLPDSASATKQAFVDGLKKRWLTVWDNSPRKERFSLIDPKFPFDGFRKKWFNLTRQQASIIMQIRTGHIPLNFYLHRIGKIDSDRCTKCAEHQDDVQPRETVNHFLFICQAYDEARNELIEKIDRRNFSISKMMKSTDRMKALVTFINRTGRLKEDK
jgi:ribonuclease HI